MKGLAVDNLAVVRGGSPILSGVCFEAPAGAVTGLIGPNGAGKSTLLMALLGLVPAAGTARFDGHDLGRMPRRERARIAAYVEQSASTEERLTVRDVAALGRIPFQSAFAAGPAPQDDAIVADALAQTGMTGFADRRFDTLSGGEQQRVQIARALAQQPRLLLLDEPSSHLDIRAQLQLLALLRRRAATGVTIMLAVHDLNLAARSCDHLVALQGGRVVAQGPPARVLTPALLLSVYGVHARLLPEGGGGRFLIVYDGAAEPFASNPD